MKQKNQKTEKVSLTEVKEEIKSPEVDKDKAAELLGDYKEETAKKERKKRITKAEIQDSEAFSQIAVMSVDSLLEIIVSRMPKKIPLSKAEKDSFNQAFTRLAQKYYPSIQRFGDEANFLISLGLILSVRMEFKKKEKSNSGSMLDERITEDLIKK